MALSTKGNFEGTDWADAKARSAVLAKLASSVNSATTLVLAGLDAVRENKRMPLARLARNLLRVVGEDLAADAEGEMQVIERTTSARLRFTRSSFAPALCAQTSANSSPTRRMAGSAYAWKRETGTA